MWKIEPGKTILSDVVLESSATIAEPVEIFTKQGSKLVGMVVRFSPDEVVIYGARKDGTECLTTINRSQIASITVNDLEGKIAENLREID